MKKLLILAALFLGFAFSTYASTTVKFGDYYTLTVDENVNLPNGTTEYVNTGGQQTMSYHFPVYWYNDNGSGSFDVSGNGDMRSIINFLLDLFFPGASHI